MATRPGSWAGLVEGHWRLGATFSPETVVDGAFGATDLSGSSSSRTSMSAVFSIPAVVLASRDDADRRVSLPRGIRLRDGSQAIAPTMRP